ncbi:hypothetical protein J8C02_04790 [Chloracidobacterium sp. MS 40/45]|uniref:hypothetical protein n=1 Tax=Chloracidobacterium aggregatum TaxID=2851959 RepID=UPI001B8AA695|nr:hypothetical protein [Chloracidobacterium aggregatum]QUW00815.1 hypothetical protein J8C02_04790 [Chloracidobacterium sp. MS 40/45]
MRFSWFQEAVPALPAIAGQEPAPEPIPSFAERELRAVCRAVYPGSFDPHHQRGISTSSVGAVCLFDHITIGVLNNEQKSPLFTVAERIEMIQAVVTPLAETTRTTIEVDSFEGLLVDFAKRKRAQPALFAALRAVSDLRIRTPDGPDEPSHAARHPRRSF